MNRPAITRPHPHGEVSSTLPPMEFLPIFKRLWGYTHAHAKVRNRLIFAVLLRAVQIAMVGWVFALVINGPITKGRPDGLAFGVVGFLLLVAFMEYTASHRIFLGLNIGEAVIRDLRLNAFAHLQALTADFYQRMKPGRIIGRMTNDIESIRLGVQDCVFVSAVNAGQLIVTAALLIAKDWQLFLIALVIAPAIWTLNRTFRRALSETQRKTSESAARVTATVAESIDGIRVTQGFVREKRNADQFRHLALDHSRYVMRAGRINAIFLPLLDLCTQIFIGLLLLAGGYRVLHGGAPIGTIVEFLLMAPLFFDPFRVIGTQYSQAIASLAGAERVFRLLDTQPDWTDPAEAQELPPVIGRIEFRHLSFGYHSGQTVLHDLSFTAWPGEVTALVGHSGSGKSSVVNLLLKAYLPSSGQLLIDGFDITRVSSASYRRQLGIVMQHNYLFKGTVLDNLRFAKPSATLEEAREAAAALGLLDLLNDLPDGFLTEVGEGGGNLSAGQRQIVSFTRALLANPRILILDEATSAIDARTEARLQQAMPRLLRGRTSFIAAHRLSTVKQADRIIVLQQGSIIESGTHEELLQAEGTYSRFYDYYLQSGFPRS